jgi:hypothetical protein
MQPAPDITGFSRLVTALDPWLDQVMSLILTYEDFG